MKIAALLILALALAGCALPGQQTYYGSYGWGSPIYAPAQPVLAPYYGPGSAPEGAGPGWGRPTYYAYGAAPGSEPQIYNQYGQGMIPLDGSYAR